MQLPRKLTLGAISAVMAGLLSLSATAQAEQRVEKVRIIDGEKYTFTKHVDAAGNVRTEVLDSLNRPVKVPPRPEKRRGIIGKQLARLLEDPAVLDKPVKVNIALDVGGPAAPRAPESGSGEVHQGELVDLRIDGREVSRAQAGALARERNAELREARKARAGQRREDLRRWAIRHNLAARPGVGEAVEQARRTVTLEMSGGELRRLAASGDPAILGIELWSESEDDIDEAMAATSISTSALPYSTTRGDGIGIYMTESGCANESRFDNYTRLAGSETNHSRNVGGIIKAVSPDSYLYCRGGAVLPQSGDLGGVGGNPPIHIVTRSNSNNDNTNYTTVDRDWDDFVYDENIATFNSGGNTGNGTGNVRSPGKGLNLVTVANYNDANDTVASSSPFVDPETGNDKPELAAPGTNITAGGFTMSGTSMSTPHAAAFSADMMSHSTYLQYRPYLVKAKIMAGATDPISGGYDKVGLGGIDFASAQWSGHWAYYSGGNGSFDTFDSNDGTSDGYIEKQIYISSSWNSVRAAIAWLNRGTYTYANRTDAHPIGMDLDFRVYDPNGAYVGGSFSWDNGFEYVNFNPTVSGNYTFKINRYANRDTASAFRLGLYVNYYN